MRWRAIGFALGGALVGAVSPSSALATPAWTCAASRLAEVIQFGADPGFNVAQYRAAIDSEINAMAGEMTPTARAQFLDVFDHFRTSHPIFGISHMPGVDGTVHTIGKVEVELMGALVNHPYMGVVAVHEADHLSRMIAKHGGFNPASLRQMYWSSDGILKEEAKAIQREYRYIRQAFAGADLAKLMTAYPPTYPEMLADRMLFVTLGMMDGSGKVVINDAFMKVLERKPDLIPKLERAIRAQMNAEFNLSVGKALMESEADYVASQLDGRDFIRRQRIWNLQRRLALGTAAGVGIAGVGGTVVYLTD